MQYISLRGRKCSESGKNENLNIQMYGSNICFDLVGSKINNIQLCEAKSLHSYNISLTSTNGFTIIQLAELWDYKVLPQNSETAHVTVYPNLEPNPNCIPIIYRTYSYSCKDYNSARDCHRI